MKGFELTVLHGDITELEVDAIVNAANYTLLGGGGVDGAIHRAAGPELTKYCEGLNGCKTGEAKITPGFELPARYVIHTVGPIYGEENGREAELLYSCYHNSLYQANESGVRSIAFPAISTGVYSYPPEEAAAIAVMAAQETLHEMKPQSIEKVIFVVFSPITEKLYSGILSKHYQNRSR